MNFFQIFFYYLLKLCFLLTFINCSKPSPKTREVIDFNANWKFHLGIVKNAHLIAHNDSKWEKVDIPHDWSIDSGYKKDGATACSTGFVIGGVGWYRKSFKLTNKDKAKRIVIKFDGIYNNSSVWINGVLLGYRPNGYIGFSYDLTPYLNYNNENNVIAVKVDHAAYADSRWYTGSGMYRKVTLLKTNSLHIKQWGVQIITNKVEPLLTRITVNTQVNNSTVSKKENLRLKYQILSASDHELITEKEGAVNEFLTTLEIQKPHLWSINNPYLYNLKVSLYANSTKVDEVTVRFGVRYFNFDADTGFSLNGKKMKLKGVNLHHDAGALGAAVPKAIWEYRIQKLKEIGVNAVRLSHNPHAEELLEVCDELGILVINEAFDEWNIPKAKSKVYLGDNAATAEATKAYPTHFDKWAEKDLKDLIKRDFNHPSVIMWSIGNEIEWTYPHYTKTYNDVNAKQEYFRHTPIYDSLIIKKVFAKNLKAKKDPLVTYANKLNYWVKEIDTTRPVTSGSVHPSIGLASGYGAAVDVYGFNYRAVEYDVAHKAYPDLKIVGSENWGAYSEWKNCVERDFVAGIFIWTGFAYLGEAGPWPRKGLNISLFDFAGFKNPRGHFFECIWNDTPKVYLVTTPETASEFSFSDQTGWEFDMQLKKPPLWGNLRLWEWYKVYSKWNYSPNESIIVQTYTNCDEAELFLNNHSLGKQKRSDFSEDNIIKWQVPFREGKLSVKGFNNGVEVANYELNTTSDISKIELTSNKKVMQNSGYDVNVITLQLLDGAGHLVTDKDIEIDFKIDGPAKNIGIDNGWEMNIQPHKSNKITTHNGKAVLFIQSTKKEGIIEVEAFSKKLISNSISINNKHQ
ncbi:glycoside hydrolase family 2 TIM barrel-domain containing protein [Aquimarina agarilytica]|uniref:glycoside hydrolase family 2 TIM barrel-domain containing protein n=1 Tax=Aquimarina agarilytica TaxID=1087449 RepID=UPI000288FEB4|nr:glycoside hydrolase family 2 TIM barrel-domain containing protein [Aquimarina agarilytica]